MDSAEGGGTHELSFSCENPLQIPAKTNTIKS